MPRLTVPPDFNPEEPWHNHCGPVALAAMIGKTMAEVRPLLGDFKGYMNARHMLAALEAAGRPGQLVQVDGRWRGIGLARIQFEGAWTKPGVPVAAALRHTHWVGSYGENIFDANFDPLRWDTWDVWEREVAPALVDSIPKATGWRVRDVIVRKARASGPAAPALPAAPAEDADARLVLFVGELNPYGGDPRFALWPDPPGCSGWLLPRRLGLAPEDYLGHFERANLLTGAKWSLPAAREAAALLLTSRPAGSALVLLGTKVAAAFGLGTDPFVRHEREGRQLLTLPHPSGLCRLWHEAGVTERARAAFAQLVSEVNRRAA